MHRLGAHLDSGIWTFAVWSHRATAVDLVVADRQDPSRVVLQRSLVREGDTWTVEVDARQLGGADLYGFRVDGPWAPLRGDRFDPSKVLLDPYARDVWWPPQRDRDAARIHGRDTASSSPWGVLRDGPSRGARGLARSTDDNDDAVIVAEVHVGSFTSSPSSGVPAPLRGTFAGVAHRLDHLAALGVTAVELLPVHATDPSEGSEWGYMPLAFCAIDARYAVGGDPAGELAELADACHARGMELWLDVVYNHTTEEDHLGPTYSLRGFDNRAYYVTSDIGEYVDDAGCGNILRASEPVVADLVVASLERLADLGVDGFRFDLATVLARDDAGLVERITDLARRRRLRLVAEPWDVVRHQTGGAFPGHTWWQWNDRFRDVVRSFVKGDSGYVAAMESVVQGSPDLFPDTPRRSVNFVTAHDGFTLRDLVSYQSKHNEANGHANTDGTNDNRSWNCGWEGDDGAPAEVRELRARQMRNFVTVLMCSAGTPMLLAGDEFARTQWGNNNAYRSHDESVWLDWTALDTSADLVRFVGHLVDFRRRHRSLTRATHWGDDVTFISGGTGHDLGWWLRGATEGDDDIVVMINAFWEDSTMSLPPGHWSRVVDTSRRPPEDVMDEPVPVEDDIVVMPPRSAMVLVSR